MHFHAENTKLYPRNLRVGRIYACRVCTTWWNKAFYLLESYGQYTLASSAPSRFQFVRIWTELYLQRCLVINFCTLFVGLAFWIICNAPFDWVYPPLGLLGPVICRTFCWLPFVSAGGGGGGGGRCTSLRGRLRTLDLLLRLGLHLWPFARPSMFGNLSGGDWTAFFLLNRYSNASGMDRLAARLATY